MVTKQQILEEAQRYGSTLQALTHRPVPSALDLRFWVFHRQNQKVYETLKRLAMTMWQKGRKQIGVGMLWEVLRWEMYLETSPDAEYKLNNSYRSRYARLLMLQEPELANLFETRELKS